MKRSTGVLKRYARNSMKGNMGVLILGMFAVYGINVLASTTATDLFPGTDRVSLILGQAYVFIISLIIRIVSVGLCYMQLNIARKREYSLMNLIRFFREQPDRIIIAGFVLGVIQMVISIPYYYVSLTGGSGSDESLEAMLNWMVMGMFMLIITAVVDFLVTIPFAMTFYLMADEPELTGIQALKESMLLMKGNMLRYLMLHISFVPWFILSVFTMYIGLLWVVPYMDMARTAFYRELRGELDRQYE